MFLLLKKVERKRKEVGIFFSPGRFSQPQKLTQKSTEKLAILPQTFKKLLLLERSKLEKHDIMIFFFIETVF